MTTQLSTKLAALGVALMVNSAMIGGVAFLFNGHLRQNQPVTSLAGVSRSALDSVASMAKAATV